MSPYRSPADMPKEPPDIPKDRNVVVPDGASLIDSEDPFMRFGLVVLAISLVGLGFVIGLAIAPSLGH